MKKPRVMIPDWLLGGLLTVIILLLFLMQFGPLESIEAKLYDLRTQLRQPTGASQKIAIVEIDEDSVNQLGRYPWPRSRIAEGLDVIAEAGAKVVGLDILYPDAEQNPGLDALKATGKLLEENSTALVGREVTLPGSEAASEGQGQTPADSKVRTLQEILGSIGTAVQELDSDSRLADSVAL
ncbi:MAG: CHASE2 domain-containing protein, partial [Acidobacteria bacterium]|nr:CHASE2 domain-containing protein [Acidobacteriota bacterium]